MSVGFFYVSRTTPPASTQEHESASLGAWRLAALLETLALVRSGSTNSQAFRQILATYGASTFKDAGFARRLQKELNKANLIARCLEDDSTFTLYICDHNERIVLLASIEAGEAEESIFTSDARIPNGEPAIG
ncbi:MAG: hypothetical protein IPM23_06535 [Candidatus Melainabacteria bacterium]|nr:hypothetical protein [Candidatus Melainabacteria bacterium]